MKITEYTLLNFEGVTGQSPYHYNVIKLGESLYYRGLDEEKIDVVTDIGFAAHVAPRFAEALLAKVKKWNDDYGWIIHRSKQAAKPLNASQLAAALGVSRAHISQALKARTAAKAAGRAYEGRVPQPEAYDVHGKPYWLAPQVQQDDQIE